jgi:hypothetical protein
MLNPCAAYPDETEPRCEDYCRILMRACDSFELAPYESTAQCEAVCEAFDKGSVMDDGSKPELEDNNTLGCRKAHAYNALIATPNIHCRHSGPGGAGVCGSNCASYCNLLQSACASEFQSEFGGGGATGLAACEESCEALGGNDYTEYSVNQAQSGDAADAFACRVLAVSRALEDPDDAAQCESALGRGDCGL